MTAEEFLQSKDIWNHPYITNRTESNAYEVRQLLEDFARQAIHQVLDEAAEEIEKEKSAQSILQCSKETGLGAVTQVYFRKGTNWAKEIILSLKEKHS